VGRLGPRGPNGPLSAITPRKRSGRRTVEAQASGARTPVVAGDHRLLRAQRVEQTHHVADRMQERILIDLRRLIRLTVAAHVGRDGVEAGLGQRR